MPQSKSPAKLIAGLQSFGFGLGFKKCFAVCALLRAFFALSNMQKLRNKLLGFVPYFLCSN